MLWGDDFNEGWGEYAAPGVQPPRRDPGTEAHYEYGSRAGVWRLARIFDEAQVPVTVSAAAVALELNPAVPAWMRERGHDLLGHGWRWIPLWDMPREEEREHLRRAVEIVRARARRAPGRVELPVVAERVDPRAPRRGRRLHLRLGRVRRRRPVLRLVAGKPFLVVPYSKTYNDSRFLMNPGFASPRDFLDTLVMGLDELVREGRPTMMTVAVHARWSGQAARAAAVRAFLEHARARRASASCAASISRNGGWSGIRRCASSRVSVTGDLHT